MVHGNTKYVVGYRVGSMTLIEMVERVTYGANRWKVKCDCGKESVKNTSDFHKLKSCSFDCPLHKNRICNKIHGVSDRQTYHAYKDMVARCTNSSHKSYTLYGGRGITVAPKWLESYDAFTRDMGVAPKGLSLDRVDNEKGYSKDNCRWADRRTQCNNRRTTIYITARGVTKPLADWAEALNVPHSKLFWRYKNGWTHDEVVYGKGIVAPFGKSLRVQL